jgi:hypothetical protein
MISRRRFAQGIATAVAATSLAGCASEPIATPAASVDLGPGSGTNTSLGPIKQIDASLLSIGYAEFGPADGPVVLLIHGWPYDPGSYIDVGPLLAAAGYRVIVPYLRGYGPTVFLSKDTFRNAQQSAVALDIVALMDALQIESAILAENELVAMVTRYLRGGSVAAAPPSTPRPPASPHRLGRTPGTRTPPGTCAR